MAGTSASTAFAIWQGRARDDGDDTRFAWCWSVVRRGRREAASAQLGEAVENLTGTGEYHWMAGNF